jgi:hypothetical protein
MTPAFFYFPISNLIAQYRNATTQSLTLTTLSPYGTSVKVSIPINTIKKTIELKALREGNQN